MRVIVEMEVSDELSPELVQASFEQLFYEDKDIEIVSVKKKVKAIKRK